MTDHDPIMDDIPTYYIGTKLLNPASFFQSAKGSWVNVSDLPALIARVREEEREKAYADGNVDGLRYGAQAGYERGQQDKADEVDRRISELDDAYAGQTNDWANGWHEALRAMRQKGEPR